LSEKFKTRLGLISSKEVWPITYHFLILLDLLYHTKGWTTAKLSFKILVQDFVRTWMLKTFPIQNRNVGFLEDKIYSICQSGFRSWSWGGCEWEATSRIPRWSFIYITDIVYTVPNRSLVHSIYARRNLRGHVNCIH
jgi:hypothetical protein